MIMFVLAYVRTRTGEVEDEAFDRHIVFGVDVVCDLGEAFEDVRLARLGLLGGVATGRAPDATLGGSCAGGGGGSLGFLREGESGGYRYARRVVHVLLDEAFLVPVEVPEEQGSDVRLWGW